MLRGLAPRLVLSLAAIVIVVEGVFAYLDVRIQEKQLTEEQILRVDELSETIKSATWHAMLADRREMAYQVMRTIGRQPNVQRVRFFNKQGRITFSSGSDAGQVVDLSAEACYLCHAAGQPLVKVSAPTRVRYYEDESGTRLLGLVTPIYNEPACTDAACHAHPADKNVLGVLDISVPLDRVDQEVSGIRWRAVLTGTVAGLLLVTLAILFTRRFVTRPVRTLMDATKRVAELDLTSPVGISSRDEIGELGGAFDRMRESLLEARRQIEGFTRDLEQKVKERTEELASAHEKLARAERLASLGRLCASVAHEINNPLSGVLNFARLMRRVLTEEGVPRDKREQFRNSLDQIIDEATRAGRIVGDLLTFSRGYRAQLAPSDLNDVVRQGVAGLAAALQELGVEAHLALAPGLPAVPLDASRIRQVVTNLVRNAAEARPVSGRVNVSTRLDQAAGVAILAVADDGQGIAPEHLPRIFEPFFTTKDGGQGIGLGLAVVYGIVEAHRGTIEVRSEPGKGATFEVKFPLSAIVEPAQ